MFLDQRPHRTNEVLERLGRLREAAVVWRSIRRDVSGLRLSHASNSSRDEMATPMPPSIPRHAKQIKRASGRPWTAQRGDLPP